MIKRGARCPSTVCPSQFSALTFIYYRTRREVKPVEQFLSILLHDNQGYWLLKARDCF